MTIIEFYDKAALDNIAGAMLCNADRVIFVGDSRAKMEKSREIYRSILRKRGVNPALECQCINRNNLQNIVECLENIVVSYDNCIFDLTGGEDLYLVAVGILMNKYHGTVQSHRFNFRNNVLYDCDADGKLCSTAPFHISVDELIAMNGGTLVMDPTKEFYCYPWSFTDDFVNDINLMWSIYKKHFIQWNSHIGTMGKLFDFYAEDDSLYISVDKNEAIDYFTENDFNFNLFPWIMLDFKKAGLIHSLDLGNRIEFKFKNEQVKRALTIEGQCLELYAGSIIRSLKESDGTPLYQDVYVGAVIDWHNLDEDEVSHSINEIDILAMKDAIPVFISCKNGLFDVNELYKLSTVADRFGDKYAKKVLVTTRLGKLGPKSEYMRARMSDMNIRCVDNLATGSDAEIAKTLRSLWFN